MLDILTAAISLATNPVALIGYVVLGVVAQRPLQALKYAVWWGLAMQVFAVAARSVDLFDLQAVALTAILRVTGAILITLGVYFLARALHVGRRGPPPGRDPKSRPGGSN